jgi:uncharacterized protein YggU (UPF0235/DUF167 family)
LRRTSTGVTVALRAQPRARRTGLELGRDGMLKALVTAPPEDGKANDAVIALLADTWHVPKSSIVVKTGNAARDKVLSLQGEPQALAVRIGNWVSENG